MLCHRLSYQYGQNEPSTESSVLEWRGKGKGVDFFVLQSYPI